MLCDGNLEWAFHVDLGQRGANNQILSSSSLPGITLKTESLKTKKVERH